MKIDSTGFRLTRHPHAFASSGRAAGSASKRAGPQALTGGQLSAAPALLDRAVLYRRVQCSCSRTRAVFTTGTAGNCPQTGRCRMIFSARKVCSPRLQVALTELDSASCCAGCPCTSSARIIRSAAPPNGRYTFRKWFILVCRASDRNFQAESLRATGSWLQAVMCCSRVQTYVFVLPAGSEGACNSRGLNSHSV